MSKPKVTVIMNTFNEKVERLVPAIKSYLGQWEVDVELIISTVEGDCNEHIYRQYPVKIAVLKKELHPGKSPLGSFMQLNNGLKLMTGDWFCFASSNDVAVNTKLRKETSRCISDGTKICYSSYYYANDRAEKTAIQIFHDYDYTKHLQGNFVSDCAIIHKSIVKKYLPFLTKYKNYAYWDLWLRVYEGEGNVFSYNPDPTWLYVQDKDSMHIKRRTSAAKINEATKDKLFMLADHGKN